MAKVKNATKTVTWAAACCTLVAGFEGCDLTAKIDTIGTGRPLTWCHGETIGPAKVGEKFTKTECDSMLEARLPSYWAEIEPCIHVKTSDNEKVAYTSFSYNVGSGAFCHGTISSKLNAGDHKGACDALMLYTHAQGKVVRGLVNRRTAERTVCLTPDNHPDAATIRKAAIPKATDIAAPLAPVPPPSPPVQHWPHWYSKFLSWSWWAEA